MLPAARPASRMAWGIFDTWSVNNLTLWGVLHMIITFESSALWLEEKGLQVSIVSYSTEERARAIQWTNFRYNSEVSSEGKWGGNDVWNM